MEYSIDVYTNEEFTVVEYCYTYAILDFDYMEEYTIHRSTLIIWR